MVLPLITSTIVAVVEGSWIAASILLKYFLILLVAKNLYKDTLTKEHLSQDILTSSRIVVIVIIGLGALISLLDLSISPFFKLFSELVALSYLVLLFWKY